MRSSAEVLIVGGSVVGCSTAWHLRAEGFTGRIVVVERDQTYQRASASRAMGGIRQQFCMPVTVQMMQYSIRLWKVFDERFATPGHVPRTWFGQTLFRASLPRRWPHRFPMLNGNGSSDPDGDALTYAWVQVGGPLVALTGDSTATPSLTTPFVSPGGADLTFQVTVDDGYGGTATDTVVVHVQNANDPPLVSAAQPTIDCLWPPNHKLMAVGITGVSDPDDNATITIDSVTQDEPTNGLGDGDTAVDAVINADGTVLLRAERAGNDDGRVYHVHFTASDLEGSAPGVVTVCVPHDRKSIAIDGGELFFSTN